ncbi:MAG: hypothetical protein M3R62_14075 [Acidobacteriota bacterium]|nr:hypothetical protein [Acidobacteriota bacterium]
MSIEGGIAGNQQKLTCPNCGKVFTAWRPDTAPGVKVKCYFCKTEVEDEASRRVRPEPPPPAVVPPVVPVTPKATVAPVAPEGPEATVAPVPEK